jgi:hypothetical protein
MLRGYWVAPQKNIKNAKRNSNNAGSVKECQKEVRQKLEGHQDIA